MIKLWDRLVNRVMYGDSIFFGVAVIILISIVGILAMGAVIAAALLITPLIFMLLWNYAVVGLLGLGAVSFWQSVAIVYLISLVGAIVRPTPPSKIDTNY